MHRADLDARLQQQRSKQPLAYGFTGNQGGRHRCPHIVLRYKRLQHLRLHRYGRFRRLHFTRVIAVYTCCIFHMGREIRPVAKVPSSAHHGQVHAGFSALHLHGQNVYIPVRHVVHRLLMQHIGQRGNLVAQLGRLLEFQLVGVRHHAFFQRRHHLLRIASQEFFGMRHILRVVFCRDVAHARCRTAFDLVQQAGPCAVIEHRVFAGAQVKHFLQQQNGFLHRPRAGVRAKVAVLLFH